MTATAVGAVLAAVTAAALASLRFGDRLRLGAGRVSRRAVAWGVFGILVEGALGFAAWTILDASLSATWVTEWWGGIVAGGLATTLLQSSTVVVRDRAYGLRNLYEPLASFIQARVDDHNIAAATRYVEEVAVPRLTSAPDGIARLAHSLQTALSLRPDLDSVKRLEETTWIQEVLVDDDQSPEDQVRVLVMRAVRELKLRRIVEDLVSDLPDGE